MPKVVVIYPGRFQPAHAGHVAVFRQLQKQFGRDSVYIGTSDKTDPERSPLSFEQKKQIWARHGVDTSHVLKISQPYKADAVAKAVGEDFEDFIFIAAVGKKDSQRLTGGKYFQQLKRPKTGGLETADKAGYYYVIPNVTVGGKVLSATDIRAKLRQPKLSKDDVMMLQKMTGLKPRELSKVKKLFEFATRRKWWPMLLEGGAAGHMTHPFEDLTLSFGELKKIISLAFEGKLQVAAEGPITEKVDGQNLFASVIGGEVRFARNKGQLKNRGQNAMRQADIDKKWKDIPHVRAAFMKAAQTLEAGLGKLPKKTQKEIFKDGQNWVNFELIAQDNPNVINYDADVIIFHNIHMVDEDGNKTGMAGAATKKLFKIFSDAERSAELSMKIQPPQIVKVDRNLTIDFSKDQAEFMSGIDKVAKSAGLSDSGTLGDLLRASWDKELAALERKHAMDLPSAVRKKFIVRFSEGDKSYGIRSWSQDVPDAAFIDDLRALDDEAVIKNKKILEPVELLVLKASVIVLKNIDTFVSANPDDSVQQLRSSIAQQIAAIRKSKDVKSIDKMMGSLKKIQAMGGFDNLVPSEGIVFRYKGKLYKITGLFAPVNQLMGLGRFGR